MVVESGNFFAIHGTFHSAQHPWAVRPLGDVVFTGPDDFDRLF